MAVLTASTPPVINKRPLACVRPGRDTSPTRLLILDSKGRIVHGNQDWFRLVEELQLTGANYQVGGDYPAACRAGWGRNIPELQTHGTSVATIMQGANQGPGIVYSFPFAGERRWFCASAIPLQGIPDLGVLVMHHEATGDIQREEKLARQAFFDALTDLPNYALFNNRLNHAIAHSSRSGEPLATMFIDLDDFKLINDTYGHLSGNRVLNDVARRLSGCLRECDTVGRLGGDEFGMLLPGIGTREAATHVADKMLAALAAPFNTHNGQRLHLTASIGIAFYPMDGISLDVLMHRADQAMYYAKETCKGSFHHSTFGFCEACHEPERPGLWQGTLL